MQQVNRAGAGTTEHTADVNGDPTADACSMVLTAGDSVRIEIVDDGVGLPEGGRRSGLANLAARAEQLGGGLHTGPAACGGTQLVWEAPLT